MSTQTAIRARIDTGTKQRACEVLERIGLPVSHAVRMLMSYIADEGRVPADATIGKIGKGAGRWVPPPPALARSPVNRWRWQRGGARPAPTHLVLRPAGVNGVDVNAIPNSREQFLYIKRPSHSSLEALAEIEAGETESFNSVNELMAGLRAG